MWNILQHLQPVVKFAALLIRPSSESSTVPKGPERNNPQEWAFMFIYVQEQSED